MPVFVVNGKSEPEIVVSVSSSPLTESHLLTPFATFVTTMANFRSVLFLPSAPELSQQLWATCSQRITFVAPSVYAGSGRIVGAVELAHAWGAAVALPTVRAVIPATASTTEVRAHAVALRIGQGPPRSEIGIPPNLSPDSD